MEQVQLKIDESGQGAFLVSEGAEQLGEMVISIAAPDLTVYHSEVAEKAEGRGLAKKMLEAMVAHARHNKLKVVPLCPYVHAQFKRHPDLYADIWKGHSGQEAHLNQTT